MLWVHVRITEVILTSTKYVLMFLILFKEDVPTQDRKEVLFVSLNHLSFFYGQVNLCSDKFCLIPCP